jgi:carbon-monoxide dehydrogenase medium subunit
MLPRFRYLKPATLGETLDLLDEHGPQARLLAGGTDLLVGLGDGSSSASHLIDIKALRKLQGIGVEGGTLRLGACVTVNRLLEFDRLPRECDALRSAASRLATYQIRNRATVGGNLCNASPACDMGPPLLVLDAKLRAVSRQGERLIPLKEFFEGVKVTCCGPCEVITEVLVPIAGGAVTAFMKRTRIKGHDLSLVNAAGAYNGETLRIAVGAVAQTPILVEIPGDTNLSDRYGITKTVLDSVSPIDDVRSSKTYRTAMVEFVVEALLDRIEASYGGI